MICGDEIGLSREVCDVYTIARARGAPLDHMVICSAFAQWNVSFIRVACDWEIVTLITFFNLLYSSSLREEMTSSIGPCQERDV